MVENIVEEMENPNLVETSLCPNPVCPVFVVHSPYSGTLIG
jgi:hypothetical protein